jgi:hypothetical protein
MFLLGSFLCSASRGKWSPNSLPVLALNQALKRVDVLGDHIRVVAQMVPDAYQIIGTDVLSGKRPSILNGDVATGKDLVVDDWPWDGLD